MHWAAVRDRQQPRTLVLAKCSIQLNVSFDHREPRILNLAGDTILRVNSRMTKVHRDPLQRPLLSPRIHCNGHGSAGSTCGQQQIARCRTAVGPANRRRLVSAEIVPTGHNLLRSMLHAFGLSASAVTSLAWRADRFPRQHLVRTACEAPEQYCSLACSRLVCRGRSSCGNGCCGRRSGGESSRR